MKVHAAKMSGMTCHDSLDGPVVDEYYEPLCGVQGDDIPLSNEWDRHHEPVTCLRCLAILNGTSHRPEVES